MATLEAPQSSAADAPAAKPLSKAAIARAKAAAAQEASRNAPAFRLVLGACDMGTRNWAGAIIEYTAPPRRRKPPRPRKRKAVAAPEDHPEPKRAHLEEAAAPTPVPAPLVAYDTQGRAVVVTADGHVQPLPPAAEAEQAEDRDEGHDSDTDDEPTLSLVDMHDPKVVEGERVRVLSILYLDLELHEILGSYRLVPTATDILRPTWSVALGYAPNPHNERGRPAMYRSLAQHVQEWDELYAPPVPLPPGVEALPVYLEQQMDDRPHARHGRGDAGTGQAINGRVAGGTFTAIAAADLARGIAARDMGSVAAKAGVPRAKTHEEAMDNETKKLHKARSVAYGLHLMAAHGQHAVVDFIHECEKSVAEKRTERGEKRPRGSGLEPLTATKADDVTDAILMAVAKARELYAETPLYAMLRPD